MKQTKQRGSAWSIKLVFNLYKIFGYKFIYLLMYPVTFFYFMFASNVKEALKIYYSQLNLSFNNRVYFNHLRMFAICMVDRFISRLSPESYTFFYQDKKILSKILEQGSILLLSHYGGWATAANAPHVKNRIHVVMQEVLLDGIKEIETSIEKKSPQVNIIDLNEGGIIASIKIANALMANEIVAIMGDRANDKKYNLKVPFFNKNAGFNKNPFQIAYKLNKPILVFFAINVGLQQYQVEYLKIDMDLDLNEIESVKKALKEYVLFFEKILKEHPSQWFNLYNFWE